MSRIFKVISFSLITALLTACGGGTIDDLFDDTTYPFRQAYTTLLNTPSNYNFTVSGSIQGFPAAGSGNVTNFALTNGSLLGVPARQRSSIVAGNVVANGISYSLNGSNSVYFDSNYNFLGETGSESLLATSSTNLPATITVGSAGTLYTAAIYSDNTFFNQVGTETVVFELDPDSIANSALLRLTTIERNLSGAITFTTTESFHLYTNGTLIPINSIGDNGSEHLVITFQ